MTITEFLLARSIEREARADEWADGKPARDRQSWAVATMVVVKERRLRKAVRLGMSDRALRQQVARYADHPDYDEAWRP